MKKINEYMNKKIDEVKSEYDQLVDSKDYSKNEIKEKKLRQYYVNCMAEMISDVISDCDYAIDNDLFDKLLEYSDKVDKRTSYSYSKKLLKTKIGLTKKDTYRYLFALFILENQGDERELLRHFSKYYENFRTKLINRTNN